MYEATWESVGTHAVPTWYDDAKLGVFIHWGLYSVPGWAPRVPDIQELLVKGGPKRMLRENPYAEWYLNSLQIKGSPTQLHHARVYGDEYPYDNFVKTFNDASAGANLDAIAEACQSAGRALRGAHDQAPRRLRAVALRHRASDKGPLPLDT